jgi:kynureninase
LGACFIHERHHHFTGHRFEGWWGSNKATRFAMPPVFDPIFTAEAWQLSNPPILSMAAINASLQIFAKAGMLNLHKKTELLTGFLMYLLREIKSENLSVITPENPLERGAQVSIQVKNKSKSIFEKISEKGIIADWREPDVIRVAPVPLYNCFEELWQFVQHLKEN